MSDEETTTITSNLGPSRRSAPFISHRHWDADIADVIRGFVEDKGGGRIRIFQSSAPGAERPPSGTQLTPEIHKALLEAEVVILIYTTDQHWSSCAYEIGVARKKGGGERIIVLHCGGAPPWMLVDSVTINLRKAEDVHKFTVDFLTDRRFLRDWTSRSPSTAASRRPLSAPPPICTSGSSPSCRRRKTSRTGRRTRTSVWSALCPRRGAAGLSGRRGSGTRTIRQHALVTYADTEAAKLFDVRKIFPGPNRDARCAVPLAEAVDSWGRAYPNSKSRWLEGLCSQIVECVHGGFPTLVWELMYSKKRGDDRWYAPFLARVRKDPPAEPGSSTSTSASSATTAATGR